MAALSESPEAMVRKAVEAVEARIRWVMVLRVVLNTALFGSTVLLNYKETEPFAGPSSKLILALVVATYVTALLYALWYRAGKSILLLGYVVIASDLLICGVLTYATGGILSGFTFLFHLWVIISAVVLGGRASLYFATGSSAVLIAVAVSMFTGALDPLDDQIELSVSLRELAYYLGINLSSLFVVAILVNSLVSRLERADVGLRAEKARRRDLAQLHADMIHSLTVGIATTRMSGDVLMMNPAGMSILGISGDPLEGEDLTKWLPDLDDQVVDDRIIQNRKSGRGRRSDGTEFPVEQIIAPLMSAEGMQRGYIVVFSDLTEIRRLETELERSRRFAALGELAASLAHEIRNPLGAVSGSVQMLAGFPDKDDEERSLLAIISREINRMGRLVDDVLHYARPKARSVESVDLSDLLKGIAQMFKLSDEAQERKIVVSIEDDLTVAADGFQLRQVLWNLLRNATQATGPGDSIEIASYKRRGDFLIEIRDTGSGIRKEDADKIFDPFFSTRARGIGIGLAVSRRIIEEHGGTIVAENRPEGGTSFIIRLPAQASSVPGQG